MILLIDIGNTNTVIGLHDGNELAGQWRIETALGRTADEYAVILSTLFGLKGLNQHAPEDAIVSSVVPELNEVYRILCRNLTGRDPLFVGPGVKTGMPILLDNPREVGADRIVNAVAAYAEYGGPLVVVDFGTATTFDVVSARGEYLGGAICPGPAMSAQALASRASKLFKVEIEKVEQVIGKSTSACIQAGIYFGYLGQIDGILSRIARELETEPQVIATGGLAGLFAQESPRIGRIDQQLTLKGLKRIYDRNQER